VSTGRDRLRVVAVADTDSYVKWAAALVADPRIDGRLIVLDTQLVVSDAQLSAALAGTGLASARRATYAELPALLGGADVVLAAARGPLARVIARVAARQDPRPVIATGLPGISYPATWLALHFRRQCDVFLLHSHREVRAFTRLAAERGIDQRFALATLPFAARAVEPQGAGGTDLVFAAQAIVPRERADRLRVARILVEAARADPSRRVVVKLRGRAGEQQTHREFDSYPDLLARFVDVPENLVVSYESMHDALSTAEGLVTVSSTAAIEAAARGVPVIALDAFGVDETLINTVFRGSGLLAGAGDVVARRFRRADPAWLADNYFHEPEDDTWLAALTRLADARRSGLLEARPEPKLVGGAAREAWERRLALGSRDRSLAGLAATAVGIPARQVVRAARAIRSRVVPAPRPSARDEVGESGVEAREAELEARR